MKQAAARTFPVISKLEGLQIVAVAPREAGLALAERYGDVAAHVGLLRRLEAHRAVRKGVQLPPRVGAAGRP